MNLNQLHYFAVLARLQHYTKASEELEITQPSLSHAVNALEKEVGTRFFEKQGRNVVLTKYGKFFCSMWRNLCKYWMRGFRKPAR